MKFGFSTIGCPGWLWKEVISAAKDMGYDGVELRGIANKMYLPATRTFSFENCLRIKSQLEELELEIPCISTSAFIFNDKYKDEARKEVRDYVNLAGLLGVPYIRVLADKVAAPGNEVDEEMVVANLKELLPFAEEKDVTLLVETNGVYADSARLKALMEKFEDDPNLGVLWDIHHPYRFYGEDPELTYARLSRWIRHIHVKDSVMENGQVAYKMTGYGDVPIRQALRLLKENEYPGYVMLEWLKRWNADLEDPGIVFSHFFYAMKRMLKTKGADKAR